MDFITDLFLSTKSKVKISLIITNRLSKGVILILMLLIFTPAVPMVFIKYYVLYHGFSKAMINNKGIEFSNTIWAIIYKALGIKRRLFLAYHPETDGAIKRAN